MIREKSGLERYPRKRMNGSTKIHRRSLRVTIYIVRRLIKTTTLCDQKPPAWMESWEVPSANNNEMKSDLDMPPPKLFASMNSTTAERAAMVFAADAAISSSEAPTMVPTKAKVSATILVPTGK